MLKAHDVWCKCGYEGEVFCENNELGNCQICGRPLMKSFSTFNFELKYNPKKDRVAWSNSNYEESQYWKEVKKQKFESGKTPNHAGSCDNPITSRKN